MAEKRRDSKGRVLWAGESQRPDGKYEFKYADNNGERHSVYSWKLVATDRVPEGKQVTESLREMEKQIKKDLEDNLLVYETRKMTLNSFWDEYIALKHELKDLREAITSICMISISDRKSGRKISQALNTAMLRSFICR